MDSLSNDQAGHIESTGTPCVVVVETQVRAEESVAAVVAPEVAMVAQSSDGDMSSRSRCDMVS